MQLARTFRLLDVPGGRKKHQGVVPRGAGIALWTGYLFWSLVSGGNEPSLPFLATGATGIFIIGYVDDMHPLPPLIRFIVHLLAAWVAVLFLPLPLGLKLLSLVWVAGVTNAFNLIDGMDGLAISLAICTALMASIIDSSPFWILFVGLASGVLLWNFPRARTFLGDGGSTFLGYICSSHLLKGIYLSLSFRGLTVALFVLFFLGGIPVLDTLIAMTRRIAHGVSPFTPDRGHAHHRLLDRGFSKWKVLLILCAGHLTLMSMGFSLLGVSPFNFNFKP